MSSVEITLLCNVLLSIAYIILIIKNYYAHTIKALVICNLRMVNYYKINSSTYNVHTFISAIIPPTWNSGVRFESWTLYSPKM